MLVANGTTNHCTWRGHNLSGVLGAPAAKAYFLHLLATHKAAYGIENHSYALMDTHPHVQCRSRRGQEAFSAFWRVVNHRFATWYNRRHQRRGQVVMDRMASPRIQDGRYQLQVMRYGDLNAVRAGLVSSPKDYAWSSYRHYAFGQTNPLITDAPEYTALGHTAVERRRAYVHLFAVDIRRCLMRRPDLVRHAFVGDADWVSRCRRGADCAGREQRGGSG